MAVSTLPFPYQKRTVFRTFYALTPTMHHFWHRLKFTVPVYIVFESILPSNCSFLSQNLWWKKILDWHQSSLVLQEDCIVKQKRQLAFVLLRIVWGSRPSGKFPRKEEINIISAEQDGFSWQQYSLSLRCRWHSYSSEEGKLNRDA